MAHARKKRGDGPRQKERGDDPRKEERGDGERDGLFNVL